MVGFRIVYNESLKFKHYLSDERMTLRQHLGLVEDAGIAMPFVKLYNLLLSPDPPPVRGIFLVFERAVFVTTQVQ